MIRMGSLEFGPAIIRPSGIFGEFGLLAGEQGQLDWAIRTTNKFMFPYLSYFQILLLLINFINYFVIVVLVSYSFEVFDDC